MLEKHDEAFGRAEERQQQEVEMTLVHSLIVAEYALAQECAHVGRALASAGLPFDAHTFVACRVLETSVAEDLDPVEALATNELRELIARSTELASGLLAGGL